MYRGPQQRRAYPAYGAFVPRGPPRAAYAQSYPYAAAKPVAAGARHPYLDTLGIQNKFYFAEVDRKLLQVLQRHPRRQAGADLLQMRCWYAEQSSDDLAIPLNVNIPFNLKNTTTCTVPEPVATKAYDKDKTRYFVKVMLLSGPGAEDEKTKGKLHLSKKLNFLLARKEHGSVAPIGGEWSAEKDGATPNDATLRKTAIRVVKDMIGVDLSKCDTWVKFLEFNYKKDEGPTCTVYLLPNVWAHFKDGIEPATQVREETKEVTETVEEEEEDPEDASKKKKVKKQVTSNKTVQIVQWRPYEMSLHSMLEYDNSRTPAEEVAEFCLFADCFHEMLQRDFGLKVIEILKKKKEENEAQEIEKKRKREEDEAAAAAKKAKTENGEVVKEEEKKEEKKEEPAKPKMKIQHTVNQEILVPFQYFDRQPHTGIISGSLRRDVLEGMMHQFGDMTKHAIDDLLLKGANLRPNTGAHNSPPSILYYIKIATTTTEVPVEEEKPEEKKEEKKEDKKEEKSDEKPAEKGDEAMEEGEATEDAEAADGAMTEASLNKLLLKDLRQMCQDKGLSTAGKKADLIERLLKAAE